MNKYKSNNNIIFSCKYHIIWCPKYRRKILIGDVEKRLKEIIKQVSLEQNVEIIEIETNKDHIHLLVNIDPSFGIMKFIKTCKGRSSNILRKEFEHLRTKLPTLWTNSCFIETVGSNSLEKVKEYIQNQQLSQRDKEQKKWKKYIEEIS